MPKRYTLAYVLILLAGLQLSCKDLSFHPDNWQQSIDAIGSLSSPKAIDLNQDGIKDIVMGGGGKEFVSTKSGVVALDGRDGKLLWQSPARNQIVGSAIFQDINADNIPDVFIGGRSAIFFALDGASGNVLWEYLPTHPATDYQSDTSIMNFYNPQWIPDIDGDGFEDLLTAYGGYIKAKPEETDRPVGYLKILSGHNGKLLSKAVMPDGKETYMSPLVYDFEQDGRLEVIFGTGGENIQGGLYKISLEAVMQGDLSGARLLVDGSNKGIIAPPLLIDINLDGIKDIVLNTVDGRMFSVNGKNNQILWEASLAGSFDTYTMPAPGYFVGEDSIPDFFASFGKGPWPNTEYSVHALFDGRNGDLIFHDTLGTFQYASPIVYDFSGDGKQDVLLAINRKVESNLAGSNMRFFGNELVVYQHGKGSPSLIGKTKLGSNLGSTPLLTDLDGDQYVDIIFAYMGDANKFYSFKNLIVEKLELPIEFDTHVGWTAYMGPQSRSIFESQSSIQAP